MGEIAKIKVNGDLESSYKIFSKNREFEKRAECHPDWNQNDATQPDYIKNRPFYTGDPVETVLVEESTVSFADTGDGFYAAEFPSTFEATVGETYKVSWDGTVYECTCVKVNQSTIIGNLSIEGTGSDTGEPFLMDVYNGVGMQIATTDTSASHTFSISGIVEPIVKIPAKFIDKDTSGYIAIHKNFTMTEEEAQNYKNAILAGKLFFVIWCGLCVNNIGFVSSNGAYFMSLKTLNGEGYIIAQNGDGLFYLNDRDFENLIIPENVAVGDTHTGIDIGNNKVIISKSSIITDVGSTNVLFQVQPDGTKSKAFDVLGNGEAVAPALILYSSTADSAKKFKITVDDSGTISATEVT